MNDHFVFETVEVVGQPGHESDILAGDTGRSRQGQAGRGAVADIGRFVARQLGKLAADRLVQLEDIDKPSCGICHRLRDTRRHDRAT